MDRQRKTNQIQKRKKRKRVRAMLIFLLVLLIAISVGLGVQILKKLFGFDITGIFQKIGFGTVEIVLDPGHGDWDPGAYVENVAEKDITLEIALKTKALLKNAGYKVALTRNEDSFLELEERATYANRKGAKVFVSIHCNSSEDGAGRGIETFYTEQKTEEDNLLAEQIQTKLIMQTEAKDRTVKTANYTVLARTQMPAALVEVGFLTSSQERSLLVTQDYQERIAEGIAKGIESYLDLNKENFK